MFSPQKSYSYMLKKQPQNMVSFKQQTLALLRQQSQKMRQLKAFISSKDEQLMIKEQQIKFLKETVRELQDEGELLIGEKNEMKLKLQRIVQEVKSYNSNVVKPICEEKQQVKKANIILKQVNAQLQKSLHEALSQFSQSQLRVKQLSKQLETMKSQMKQEKNTRLQMEKKLQKEWQNSNKQHEQMAKLRNELNSQSSRRQKLQTQASALNKQLSSVINKHNTTIKDYQMKISHLMSSKIDVAEVIVYQELVKAKEQQLAKLNTQIMVMNKSHQETLSKHLAHKDKHIKQIAQLNITHHQILTDLTNLNKSIELNKKIVEFQSQHSDLFYAIHQKHEQLAEQLHQLQQQHQQLQTQNQQLSRNLQKLSQRLKDSQIQQTLMKTQLQSQLQRLDSTYQGKLLSLNLKIKKEQEALQKLKKTQLQAMQDKQNLSNQIHHIQQDFTSYKQTTQNSLLKLNTENYRILNQMQSLHQICSDNIDSKRILDKIKHVMNTLLTGLNYLQLQIVKNKQKQKHIYLPLLHSYLILTRKISLIQTNITQNQAQSNIKQKQAQINYFQPTKKIKKQSNQKPKDFTQCKNLRKLRIAVYVVIGSIRIQKGLQKIGQNQKGSTGLNLKLLKAVNTRNKTFSMNQLLQKSQQAYHNHQEPQTILSHLLKNTQQAFTWPQLNFPNLKLNTDEYLHTLAKIQTLTMQQLHTFNLTQQIKI